MGQIKNIKLHIVTDIKARRIDKHSPIAMAEEQDTANPEVVVGSPERDIQVKAIVQLEKVEQAKNEDGETEVFKMRAKLYRYFVDEEDGSTWKERGVGDVRILKNTTTSSYRLIMRRDQTLKICLNHSLLPRMEIRNHATSEKALLWSTPADFADGESKAETFCIRFGKPEGAADFKAKFEECVSSLSDEAKTDEESDKLAENLSGLKVKEEKDNNDNKVESETKENGDIKNGDIKNGEAETKT